MSTSIRWDLSNVYPSLESAEFNAAINDVRHQIELLEQFSIECMQVVNADAPVEQLAAVLGEAIDRFNRLSELTMTIRSYIYSFTVTDSRNNAARKKFSEYEQDALRVQKCSTEFQSWVGKIALRLEQALPLNATAQAHAFSLREMAEQAKYLMADAEEKLAAELSLSGARAWGRLQAVITSQLSVDFELDGEVQTLSMPALINLHTHPDEAVCRRAYEAELKAWDSVREPLAACMNGIKGAANTLNQRRGRSDALHEAIDHARIDRPTLDAMLGAMQASFPAFREYFKTKARYFGKEKLAWWDVFAPVESNHRTYTFDEARTFILHNFSKFSPDLAAFAQRSFEHNWIDAEQREGKRGGAFCMRLPGVKESRVLCNFDGSLDQVFTIAHELGHAYHNECMYRAGKTVIQSSTPATLAETASIMCETIVSEAILAQATDPAEELAIRELRLMSDAQVIVDIYSRYLFEKEVFERRQQSELSADDLCDIMERAQKASYGDGLDENYLHKYMWTWKPHYYYADMSFYNFPYAFGLLFGIGLYAIYQQRGAAFVPDYRNLLASTGEGSAADLAERFGIDIRTPKFWEDSLAVIEKNIERYRALSHKGSS